MIKDVDVNWDSFLPIRQVGTHARTRQLGDSFGVVMHNTPHVIVRVQGALLRGIMTVMCLFVKSAQMRYVCKRFYDVEIFV